MQKQRDHLGAAAAAAAVFMMQASALPHSLCPSLSLSLRLRAPSQPEDFLGGQSAGEENQFVKGRKSERSLVPLLFFCLLSTVNPLSVIIHGRQ